ncbi:MAG: phospho-N-acetylmuramoyl-pentapeptide-transferase [Clostridiales Family XIII bacterium]|jgi:phospho-N-acetylmuramoyl-pentapeptide-transferase|nr:phospho-N-acetylmuramoyl-pentapeptide-transferase [Clostridiales Family XIII bacterium]
MAAALLNVSGTASLLPLAVLAGLVALVATGLLGWFAIPLLKRMNAGQSIREDGPESHLRKEGTPTMGGVAIIAGTLAGCFLAAPPFSGALLAAEVFVAFGALGFFDDYVKVRMKRSLGLRAWQKLALQVFISVPAALYQVGVSEHGTSVYLPFLGQRLELGPLYLPFVVFVFVAMVNGVNLTDGLDGLAAGVTAQVAALLAVAGGLAASVSSEGESDAAAAMLCAALAGACLGFLIHNRKPAKMFMGDTGSLALGGGLAVAATMTHMELLLPIAGLVYVAEALSVVLQVGSYKLRGKRLFRMAPLHHHFELGGWSEEKVVRAFWAATLALCLLALAGAWRFWDFGG